VSKDVHTAVAARHPEAVLVVPPRATSVPNEAAEAAPTQRDAHLQCVAERGRMGVRCLEMEAGHRQRTALAYKRRQETEAAIAAEVLDRMLDFGRPKYARTA
jgi:hypothetical protein